MVGEGVLLTSLAHPDVKEVLMVNRRHADLQHPKLKELIVPDFMQLEAYTAQLTGYNACFYCAGISSVGLDEAKYTIITYDTTMTFATKLAALNPGMTFNFVSGAQTDASEKGKVMWARVKGRTENALKTLPFRQQFNFRPGGMKAVPGQKNSKALYKVLVAIMSVILPKLVCTIADVGHAMINAITKGYPKHTLETVDIKVLAKG